MARNPDLIANLRLESDVKKESEPVTWRLEDLVSRHARERKEQKRPITFYADADLEDALTKLKRETGQSMTVLVERLLRDALHRI